MVFLPNHAISLLMASLASSGGRQASTPDKLTSPYEVWSPRPPTPTEAKCTIIQITDVYTLDNFAHVKTLLKETREKVGEHQRVVSLLTGDFLAPYLLSSVDRGDGMMNALAKTPIDYLTWGNHEADIDHKTVCRHVRNFPGKFINTNMQDHETMDCQLPFEIIEVTSPDGSNKKKIGLIAVLSDDRALYKHFKEPGAFGGAKIRDPWKTLEEYKALLESPPYNCDLIIPLQHLYVPDDHKTCETFDFPVILSGHDHHRVDEVVSGTRLLKPGQDAIYATALEVCWEDSEADKPKIKARFVKTDEWEADEELAKECNKAYDVLAPLRDTELARVPLPFQPLSSVGSRGKVCTMGKLVCSLIKSALNCDRNRKRNIDAVLLMGGNIRGGTDYSEGCFFSLEALEAEIKSNEVVGVVTMPGWLLARAISETHAGDPIPGWMQYDSDVVEEHPENGPPVVTQVAGMPLSLNRNYTVATKVGDLTNGQSPALTEYFQARPDLIPPKGNYFNIHSQLMEYFARNLWRKIWEEAGQSSIAQKRYAWEIGDYSLQIEERFEKIDTDQDGIITIEEIHSALENMVGLSVDSTGKEKTLAKIVHAFADIDDNGTVDFHDFQVFSHEIPFIYRRDKWRLACAKGITANGNPEEASYSVQASGS